MFKPFTPLNSSIGGTCSHKSFLAGSNQKVFSYTMYGSNHRYWDIIERTLKSIKQLYPGWYVRIYTDRSPCEFLEGLEERFDFLHICKVNDLPSPIRSLQDYPSMLWRYHALGDKQISIVNFRDSDSDILKREKDAVTEWLTKTNYSVHLMRDNPSHFMPIMGGMWGVRLNDQNREKFINFRNEFFKLSYKAKDEYDQDQHLLQKLLWPEIQEDFIAHDSYSCLKFNNTTPFPTKRYPYTHVGAVSYLYPSYNFKKECPIQCRPSDHLDWIYC